MRSPVSFALAFAALLAPATAAAAVGAEGPDAVASVQLEDHGPNRLLLATGIATLGFTYGVSSYLGVTSARESDRWLLVPFSGPFVAVARREPCGERPAIPCDTEPTYKALLIVDGGLQLAGAALIALAFVKRELRETPRPLVMPLAMRGGAGVAAVTVF